MVAAIATLMTACSGGGGGGEADAPRSAEYQGGPLTLTIGTDDSPGVPSADQIRRFATEVDRLSDGQITIKPRWHAQGDRMPLAWDQAVAAMVQDGELDLALGPTWAWDVLGVSSLRPLQVPFLVDSDELVAGVVTDDSIAAQLMSGLDDQGVEGISLWPEGLRHPFGFETPLHRPADYENETIRSPKSRASTELFGALGARTSPSDPDAQTMAGIQSEFALGPTGIGTANITFFPKVNVLYANADTYSGLDPAAQEVLAEAAGLTQESVIKQTDDVAAARAFCADGGTVVLADGRDVRVLRRAVAPVGRQIAAEPGNADVVAAIESLKKETPGGRPAETCAARVPQEHEPGQAEAALNGTYRYTVTREQMLDAGLSEENAYDNAGTQTYVLDDGVAHFRLDPSERPFSAADLDETDGTYQVDGAIVTFRFPAYNNEIDRMTFDVLPNGDLRMTGVQFNDDVAEFLMTADVWQRIS